MSFSVLAKNELARTVAESDCCAVAELSAFAHVTGRIDLKGSGNFEFYMNTEHAPTARCMLRLIKTRLNIRAKLITKENKLKKKHIYTILINEYDQSKTLLKMLKFLDEDGSMHFEVSEELTKKECCKIAFLRGSFLGSGSISDPEKGYHLEFVANTQEFSDGLLNILSKYEIKAKQIKRKETFVVYIKEGDSIIKMLTLIGAYASILELENIRISKDMKNNINRTANCEAANYSKTVDASIKQVRAIIRLKETGELNNLPPSLLSVAEARINNKFASLSELVTILDGKIGKSGVNHRLRRICEIADKLD
jgi:cell division protein WhiA